MRRLLALLALIWPATEAASEDVVLGLSRDEVAISADFEGSEILIYGAVKRETEILDDPPLQVVVTVAGPLQPLTVRRKERRFGIWVNTSSAVVDAAPSFYAVATSAPWDEVISHVEDLRHSISIPRAIRAVGLMVEDAGAFSDALIRIRTENGLYQLHEGAVELSEQTLFSTAIAMPANLTEGAYPTRIFLTRSGQVVSRYETVIDVRKVGLERWLFMLSRNEPMAYGLMSILLAVAAGWGANAAFRALRSG